MERITVDELQENFDEVFDRLSECESFLITQNGVDIAVLLPYEEYEELIDVMED